MSADPAWRTYLRAADAPLAPSPCAVVPHSTIMMELVDQVAELGAGDHAVLILGEPGLAKGCHAEAIHAASTRRNRRFASVTCVDLRREDFERIVSGSEDQPVSRTLADDPGITEAIRGGSLFFNEVGALNAGMQDVLHQMLAERAVPRRDGGSMQVDARIIASSSVDLVEAVNAGAFREDLYYRLSAAPMSVPPVRVRGDDDVSQLLDQITRSLAREMHGSPSRLSAPALQRLVRYPWPGNIREMRNVMERALIAARGADSIGLAHLPPEVRDPLGFDGEYVPRSLAELERLHIERTLRRHRQNRTHAAAELGISRATLIKKIREFGLSPRVGSRRVDTDDAHRQ